MIIKAALLLFQDKDGNRELMFVRAKNKDFYVFPGGKQEPDESIDQALARELQEELKVGLNNIHFLGQVNGFTPDGRALQMHLYSAEIIGKPIPSAEIVEILWLKKSEVYNFEHKMTPMTFEHVLPFIEQNNLW